MTKMRGGPEQAVGEATDSTPGLFDVRPCLRDPVFGTLRDRWGLSPLAGAGLFLLFYPVGTLFFCWISGTAFPRDGLDRAFVQDRLYGVLYWLVIPVGVLLALRFFAQVESVFERLYSEGVVRAPREDYNRFLERLHRLYNAGLLHFLALALGLIMHVYRTYDNAFDPIHSWVDLDQGLGAIYHLGMGLVVWYLAYLVVLKAGITAWGMQRVFDWPVNIQPFHADGCGGLRLLTDISVTFALLAALVALGVVLFISAGTPLFSVPVLTAVFLLALTPLVFAAGLYRAHRVMSDIQASLLRQINQQVQPLFQTLCGRLEQGDVGSEVTEEVLRLEALHGFARRLPIWPTNTQIVAQVLLSVALPLTLLILQLVLEHGLDFKR